MKTAFIFPGQGAQYITMGSDIIESFPAASHVYERANEILGFDLKKICFEGPEEELNSTIISQPAIFTTSAALLEIVRTELQNILPDVTAGLSLGEYTALYAAGVINFDDTLKLVQKRGQAMQQASNSTEGSMVSIIGLDEVKIQQLCDEARGGEILEAVNFNCPGQIVISGSKSACERAESLAEQFGAIKAVRLSVAGAFHTDMMKSAAQQLGEALEETHISNPSDIKIIANISGDYYKNAEEIREGLKKQLVSPILWQNCMERLISEGIETFYEIGPARVLTGLMKRINRKAKVVNISTLQAFE